MLIQHVKGYPDPSTYSKNKGGITLDTDCETPCIYEEMIINDMMMTDLTSILNLFVARFRDIVYPYYTYISM